MPITVNSPREKAVGQSADSALPDWPALAARIVDDLSRIAQAEIRLAAIGLRDALTYEVDRTLKLIIALAAFGVGALFLLGAVVLLLHQLLEHWWIALAVTGGFLLLAGIAVALTLPRRRNSLRPAQSSAGS